MRRAASRWMRSNEITVQFEEATAIRLLIAEDDPVSRELACRWVQEGVDRLAAQNHPQPLLRARRLLAAHLAATERGNEAKRTLATVAAQCAQLGLFRFLLDSGPHVRADFLDRLVNAEVVQRI
jgi:hypothetical protein